MKGLVFVGWCKQGTHDKIWGYAVREGRAITFWGRRTANLTFKRISVEEARELADEKLYKKGYKEIQWELLCGMDPEFEERFHEKLTLTMLGNFWHTTGEYAQAYR